MYVHFDGMVWPHPSDPHETEWLLRYGDPTKPDLLLAASYISAYRQLVWDSQRVRNKKIRALRDAVEAR